MYVYVNAIVTKYLIKNTSVQLSFLVYGVVRLEMSLSPSQ